MSKIGKVDPKHRLLFDYDPLGKHADRAWEDMARECESDLAECTEGLGEAIEAATADRAELIKMVAQLMGTTRKQLDFVQESEVCARDRQAYVASERSTRHFKKLLVAGKKPVTYIVMELVKMRSQSTAAHIRCLELLKKGDY